LSMVDKIITDVKLSTPFYDQFIQQDVVIERV